MPFLVLLPVLQEDPDGSSTLLDSWDGDCPWQPWAKQVGGGDRLRARGAAAKNVFDILSIACQGRCWLIVLGLLLSNFVSLDGHFQQ